MYLKGKMDSLIHNTARIVLISIMFRKNVPVISGMPLFLISLSFIVHRTTVSVQFSLSLEIPMICVRITWTFKIRLTISFSVVTTGVL